MNIDYIGEKVKFFLDVQAEKTEIYYSIQDMTKVRRKLNTNFDETIKILSQKELKYFNSIIMPKYRLQWFSGRTGVKAAFQKLQKDRELLIKPESISILNGKYSKPYIEKCPDINISISHSYPFCIAILSEKNIGIDLEKYFIPNTFLLNKYYTKDEIYNINNIDSNLKNKLASYYWTRKEAVSKLIGLGMKYDYKLIDTTREYLKITDFDKIKIAVKSFFIEDICISYAFAD